MLKHQDQRAYSQSTFCYKTVRSVPVRMNSHYCDSFEIGIDQVPVKHINCAVNDKSLLRIEASLLQIKCPIRNRLIST